MITDSIQVRETIVLDADANLRITGDGYLVCNPRVARTGIQIYSGAEVGKPHMDKVRVYRPEEEVFSKDAMASIAFRPITNNHPPELVDASNWKKYSAGNAGGDVARDGEFVRVPMCVMDGQAVRDIRDGKKEISLGYGANLEWRSGVNSKGEAYDAVQTSIRCNHIAVVDSARGGPLLSIGDDARRRPELEGDVLDSGIVSREAVRLLVQAGQVDKTAELSDGDLFLGDREYPIGKKGKVFRRGVLSAKARAKQQGDAAVMSATDALLQLIDKQKDTAMDQTRKMTVDGIAIEVSDLAAQVFQRSLDASTKIIADNKALLDAAGVKVAELVAQVAKLTDDSTKALAAKDVEITTLKQQVTDSAITPAKLDQLVKDRALTITKAKAIIGDKLVVDGKTEHEIRKQVVDAKLGDAAKAYTDDFVKISFDTLTSGVEIRQDGTGTNNDAAHNIARAFGGVQTPMADASTVAYEKGIKKQEDAWKNPGGQA